jgi:hypothetical protein
MRAAQMKPLTFGVAKMFDHQTHQTKPYAPFDACTASRLYPTQNKGKVLEPDHFDYLEAPYLIHSNLNKNRIGRLLNMEFIHDQFSHGLGRDFVLMLYENRCRELY